MIAAPPTDVWVELPEVEEAPKKPKRTRSRGKKTAEAAHAYINLFLDTEFQREFALTQGVVPENLEAMKDLAKDPVLNRMLVLDPAKIARMLNPDYSKVNLSDWHDQWARTVAK